MVFFAVTHLIYLGVYAILTGNLEVLNLFYILDLQLLFPSIETGLVSALISVFLIAAVAMVVFLKTRNHNEK